MTLHLQSRRGMGARNAERDTMSSAGHGQDVTTRDETRVEWAPPNETADADVTSSGNARGREMERHELFELLDVINPRWRVEYKTLRGAALAAGVLAEYNDYLQTPQGIQYLQQVVTAHDHARDNEMRKAQMDAEVSMAAQAGFRFRSPLE